MLQDCFDLHFKFLWQLQPIYYDGIMDLHSSWPHRTQPISGHWNIWEGCFESFSTEEPFTSNLVLVDLLLLLLLLWMFPDISDPKKSFSTFMPVSFCWEEYPISWNQKPISIKPKEMEVSIQQIIFISNLLKFPLMW